VQTDIYVRYQKMLGNRALFVCADDTHGTPIQLNALKKGITPEQLVEEVWHRHVKDYAGFSIGFDIFYTTNSPENKRYADLIYSKLREQGLIEDRKSCSIIASMTNDFCPIASSSDLSYLRDGEPIRRRLRILWIDLRSHGPQIARVHHLQENACAQAFHAYVRPARKMRAVPA